MELTALGSSSKENCYLLNSDSNQVLIIEAGVPFMEVQKALNYNVSNIVGCIITHDHKDHCQYAREYALRGIKIFASKGTINAMRIVNSTTIMQKWNKYHIGEFSITPFETKHDCTEPFGYIISHREMGNLLFATDTYYLDTRFVGLDNIMIECNHCEEIIHDRLLTGEITQYHCDRLLRSHMSIQSCKNMLLSNNLHRVQSIILLHLSSDNANATTFRQEIMNTTGKMVFIASKGLKLELNKK